MHITRNIFSVYVCLSIAVESLSLATNVSSKSFASHHVATVRPQMSNRNEPRKGSRQMSPNVQSHAVTLAVAEAQLFVNNGNQPEPFPWNWQFPIGQYSVTVNLINIT